MLSLQYRSEYESIYMYQSKQRLTEMNSTNELFDHAINFNTVKIQKIKDISCVEVCYDSLYVGTKESRVYVFDMVKKYDDKEHLKLENQKSFYPHCSAVYFIVASDLYLIIVPIEEQQLIRIWNRDTLTIIHGYKGHEKQITSVIFLKDKNRIASTSYDGTVRIWDANENFEFDQELKMYVNKYPLLALVEIDEETVAFGGDDCFITIWNWSKEVVRYKCFAHPGSITSLSTCSPHFLYSIGGDSRIIAWRIEIINEEKVKVDFDLSLNDEIKPPETERKFHLTQVKEFTEHITQNLFTINISHHEVLAIDSRGNTYLMTHNLDIYSSKVKLDYTESIRHAKLWRNSFLVVTTKKGRGELKEVEADFEHVIRQEKGREMIPISAIKTTIIQITTKNSIEASINAQSTKIMARRQEVDEDEF